MSTEKKLIPLEEWNDKKYKSYHREDVKRGNGIACPKCGSELYDNRPNELLTSMPPQKNVKCTNDNCDYVGFRIA